MKYLRQLRPTHLGFLVVLSLVTIAFGIGAQTLQAAPPGVPPGVARLAGPWQATLVWSGSGCGAMSGVVNFTLDKSGADHNATLRTHGACGDNTTTETFSIDRLNHDGSGKAGLTCNNGVGCGWVLTIQVDRDGKIFNMADIDSANPGNFVAGTAIMQRSSDEGDNGK